ncbi:IclR family transcriptional regulator [Actinomadura vinacea]|uniref:IclR family transcriptional regulator n=1 Tax=Actinomadura vinacea TaxID=115336 RepID=A0ABP5X5P1_9ACTN
MSVHRDYTIESLDTGLRLMRLFLTHDRLTVTGAAHELRVARSTAHRVLSTLVARGFAIRDVSGRGYAAGPELVRIGRPAGFDAATRTRLRPVLDDAARRTGETVQTVALLGDQIVITDGRESWNPVRVMLEVGRTHLAHSTSGGKLLLSRLTTEQVRALYPDERLPAVTADTITSRAALLDELDAVRARGYATSLGESHPGMHAAAVPLAGSSWRDRLALMSCVPLDRGGRDALARLAGNLLRSAAAGGHTVTAHGNGEA